MILASIDWLSISINLLLILFVLTALLMSLLIMMQRPKQEGLGAAFGSGMTDQMFGARTTNVLQKGTVYLGSLFFILALTLAILYAKKNEGAPSMVAEETAAEVEEPAVAPPEAGEEDAAVPSLEDELEGRIDAATDDAGDQAAEEPEAGDGAAEDPAPDAAPADEAPADETPADETPADETPADETPADEAPVDETPVDEASVEEEPAGQP